MSGSMAADQQFEVCTCLHGVMVADRNGLAVTAFAVRLNQQKGGGMRFHAFSPALTLI